MAPDTRTSVRGAGASRRLGGGLTPSAREGATSCHLAPYLPSLPPPETSLPHVTLPLPGAVSLRVSIQSVQTRYYLKCSTDAHKKWEQGGWGFRVRYTLTGEA